VVNQCFARWSNKRRAARGQVVMQRMRSPQIQIQVTDDPRSKSTAKRPFMWPSRFGIHGIQVTDDPRSRSTARRPCSSPKKAEWPMDWGASRWSEACFSTPALARIPRHHLVEPNSTNHCTWRSHNHSLVFDSDEARQKFLDLLARYKALHGVLVHAYCLMGTHPHVVCTSSRGQPAFSAFWKVVNQCFARWSNKRRAARGQVVMQRMRSPQIRGDGKHLLTVMRYGDLNPVRAKLVRSAKDWRWSSHRHYAFGEANPLLDVPDDYLALGRSEAARRLAYQRLFARALVAHLVVRRPDIVDALFIGPARWVARRLARVGAGPPAG
jgi:putative transposase